VQPPHQQPQQPPRQFYDEVEGDEKDIELSDFEVTNGEEEDIFVSKLDDFLCKAKKNTNKWFHCGIKRVHRILELMT
jgi:hypothetical protein